MGAGMSLAGVPFTGQAVPGMEAARARSAAFARNAGRCARTQLPAGVAGGGRERGDGRDRKPRSTVAGRAGGPARSSGEAP